MSTSEILRREGMAFRRAAQHISMFEPRHCTEGVFDGKHLRIAGSGTSFGGRAIDLSGLDYLALGSDPQIKQIMMESLVEHDAGIPGSEAIIQMEQSRALERALARYHFGACGGTGGDDHDGAAITFTAGYGANFSVMEALGLRLQSHFITMHRQGGLPEAESEGIPTVFFIDGDLHFSARHGIRFARKLAPARCVAHTFGAGDYQELVELLAADRQRHGDRAVRVIVTDTVESATGKLFDMAALCRIAEEHDCLLYVDEAHAVGVMGPGGRGVTANLPDFARYRDRLLIMGTLTKAFCQPGGYVVMRDPALAQMLKFCSPQHVFSAPIAPWVAAALVRIIELVGGEFGDRRRERLLAITRRATGLLQAADFELIGAPHSPILATPLRDAGLATAVLEEMQASGFLVSVFQGPLMPVGREVIRIAMRADLDPEELERLVAAMVRCRDRHRPAFGLSAPAPPPAPARDLRPARAEPRGDAP